MDLLSAHYAAPSLLFCERGMQDLHLKASAPPPTHGSIDVPHLMTCT